LDTDRYLSKKFKSIECSGSGVTNTGTKYQVRRPRVRVRVSDLIWSYVVPVRSFLTPQQKCKQTWTSCSILALQWLCSRICDHSTGLLALHRVLCKLVVTVEVQFVTGDSYSIKHYW